MKATFTNKRIGGGRWLVVRNFVPTPGGSEFEMIRTTYRRKG